MKKTIALLALTLAGTQIASAVLNLDINTVDKTFTLTGSDTGVSNSIGYFNFYATPPPVAVTAYQSWTYSVGNPPFATTVGTWDNLNITAAVQPTNQFRFNLGVTNANTSQTILGSGWAISYSSLTSASQASFESLIGSELVFTPSGGSSGMSNITVTGAVVPEPSAYALISGVLAFACIGRRRQR